MTSFGSTVSVFVFLNLLIGAETYTSLSVRPSYNATSLPPDLCRTCALSVMAANIFHVDARYSITIYDVSVLAAIFVISESYELSNSFRTYRDVSQGDLVPYQLPVLGPIATQWLEAE
jgi:hypothetical protein